MWPQFLVIFHLLHFISTRPTGDVDMDYRMQYSNRKASNDIIFRSYKNAPDLLPTYGALKHQSVIGKPDFRTGQRVAKWSPHTHQMNPEELGSYAGGDILVVKSAHETRNGLVAPTARWPGGYIPYVIGANFNPKELDTIKRSFEIYHDLTCIRFIPWNGHTLDYISIENNMTGCWASVGRTGGRQVVNLQSPGCLMKVGTVLHELMHTAGFLHEQNRYERDSHVTILWNNVAKGKEDNFKKAPKSMAMSQVPYDYDSVMHYTLVAFSSNGQPTIQTKDPNVYVGQREGLSRRDVQKLRLMYKCEGTTSFI